MNAWRILAEYPLYEINRRGVVKQVRDGRILQTSRNQYGEHYHLESKSGRVVAIKKAALINWAFPKETA